MAPMQTSTALAPWPPVQAVPDLAVQLRRVARSAVEEAVGDPLGADAWVDVSWSPDRVQVCVGDFCVDLAASGQQLSLEQAVITASAALGESLAGF